MEDTKLFQEQVAPFGDLIARYTPQLFIVKKHETTLPPDAWGSAVLIVSGDYHCLVTAAHCFHNVDPQYVGVMLISLVLVGIPISNNRTKRCLS